MSAGSLAEEFAVKRRELLGLLTSMGFDASYASLAIARVDPTLPNAAELCFHWMEENPAESVSAGNAAVDEVIHDKEENGGGGAGGGRAVEDKRGKAKTKAKAVKLKRAKPQRRVARASGDACDRVEDDVQAVQAVHEVEDSVEKREEVEKEEEESSESSSESSSDEEVEMEADKAWQYALDELVAMGFETEECLAALDACENDLHRAIVHILSGKAAGLREAITEEQRDYERLSTLQKELLTWDDGLDEGELTKPVTEFDDQEEAGTAVDPVPGVPGGDAKEDGAAVEELTEQITKLQRLVLSYQTKYLALKKRTDTLHAVHADKYVDEMDDGADEDEEEDDDFDDFDMVAPPPPPPPTLSEVSDDLYEEEYGAPPPPPPSAASTMRRDMRRDSDAPPPPSISEEEERRRRKKERKAKKKAKKAKKRMKKQRKEPRAPPPTLEEFMMPPAPPMAPPGPPGDESPPLMSEEEDEPEPEPEKPRLFDEDEEEFFEDLQPTGAAAQALAAAVAEQGVIDADVPTPGASGAADVDLFSGPPDGADEEEDVVEEVAAPPRRIVPIIGDGEDEPDKVKKSPEFSRRAMIERLKAEEEEARQRASQEDHGNDADPSQQDKKPRAKAGWVNTGGYRTISIDVLETIELAAKLGKTFFCVARLDSTALKTPLIKTAMIDSWMEHFEFPLVETSQNISVTIFDNDDGGYVGRAFLSLESLSMPRHQVWCKLVNVRPSLYDELRSAAKRTSELHIRVEASTKKAEKPEHHMHLQDAKQTTAVGDALRGAFSKGVVRFRSDGFDLDLTYITDRIIAMGYPSSGTQAVYRNRMSDVQRFFEKRHPNRFKVYNLSAENSYSKSKFKGRVAKYPIPEYGTGPFVDMIAFCRDVEQFLNSHAQNVIAVHGKLGRRRTGMMIAAYLVYSRQQPTARAALAFFNEQRSQGRAPVSMPSQVRAVHYMDHFVNGGDERPQSDASLGQVRQSEAPVLHLTVVRILGVPAPVRSTSVKTWFVVTMPRNPSFKFSSRKKIKPARFLDKSDAMLFAVPSDKEVPLQEDLRVEFFYGSTLFKKSLFALTLNTRFIGVDPDKPGLCKVRLTKSQLDGAHKSSKKKDKWFDPAMSVELIFRGGGGE